VGASSSSLLRFPVHVSLDDFRFIAEGAGLDKEDDYRLDGISVVKRKMMIWTRNEPMRP